MLAQQIDASCAKVVEEEAWDTYLMRILPWAALWYTLGYRIPNDFPDMHPHIKREFDFCNDRAFELWNRGQSSESNLHCVANERSSDSEYRLSIRADLQMSLSSLLRPNMAPPPCGLALVPRLLLRVIMLRNGTAPHSVDECVMNARLAGAFSRQPEVLSSLLYSRRSGRMRRQTS